MQSPFTEMSYFPDKIRGFEIFSFIKSIFSQSNFKKTMKGQNILPFGGFAAIVSFAISSAIVGWHHVTFGVLAMIFLTFLSLLKFGKKVEVPAAATDSEPVKTKDTYETVLEHTNVRTHRYKVFWLFAGVTLVTAVIMRAIDATDTEQLFTNTGCLLIYAVIASVVVYYGRKAWYALGFDVALDVNFQDMKQKAS